MDVAFGVRWNSEVLQGLSARNMILLGQGIAMAAERRKESRGAHHRSDFPDMDDTRWKANIVVTMDDEGELKLRPRNVDARENTN